LTGAWTTPVQLTVPIVVSLVLLGVFGTGLAYVWNMRTIETWGPVRASMVTYVTPIVGVALGMVILGERLTWNEPAGMLVTFVGIAFAQGLLAWVRGLSGDRVRVRTGGASDVLSLEPGLDRVSDPGSPQRCR
jgi:EamA-like transporter family.